MNFERRLLAARGRALLAPFTRSLEVRDLFYGTVFMQAAEALRLKLPPLYPVGAAANYSLLYVLLRTFSETPVSNGLELGLGQSTLLLNAMNAQITSVDHDVDWVERIGSQVAHEVIHAPLVSSVVRGLNTMVYDFNAASYDFVLVDGPLGSPRRSRWGALEILDKLGDEFLVIFDDASRRGEQDTIRAFLKGRPNTRAHIVSGTSSQCLIFTPKFGAAAWF